MNDFLKSKYIYLRDNLRLELYKIVSFINVFFFNANNRIADQQRIVFILLLISTHVILSMSESTVLKFNYSDTFVLSSTLLFKYQIVISMSTTLTSNS